MNALIELVPKVAKYIAKSKYAQDEMGNKLVEIVLRDQRGKISNIVKCMLPQVSNSTQQTLSVVTKQILQTSITSTANLALGGINSALGVANIVQNEIIRQSVNRVAEDVKTVMSMVNNLSSLSWVNMGLTAANTGVLIAGFYIINQKLNSLQSIVNTISTKVDSIHKMSVDMVLVQPSNEIIVKSKMIASKLETNQEITVEEINDLLQFICSHVPSFLTMGDKVPVEDLLTILYEVLPIAVNTMELYYEKYGSITNFVGFRIPLVVPTAHIE